MKPFIIILLSVSILACNNSSKEAKPQPSDTVAAKQMLVEPPKTIVDLFTESGDSLILPAFDITIQLSPKAEEKLRTGRETIIVDAFFSGIPKDSTILEKLQDGQFHIGEQNIEITGPGTAHFTTAKVSKKNFIMLADKDFEIGINVYSGRRSFENNLLDCETLFAPVSKVRQQNNILKGKLIGE